jgi:hypothetical protein
MLNTIYFDDVYKGLLHTKISDTAREIGLSYEWFWRAGEEFDAGLILHHAPSGEEMMFTTDCDGEIQLSLKAIDDKANTILEDARRCQRFRDEAGEVKLTCTSSQHDHLAAIAENEALGTYLKNNETPQAA